VSATLPIESRHDDIALLIFRMRPLS